jgi:hypothetical protein
MDIRGLEIGGVPAHRVRDALRAFCAQETQFKITRGIPGVVPRKLTARFLGAQLSIDRGDASVLLAALISLGYVDANKLTPTSTGMALATAADRERISIAHARCLVDEFLEAVAKVNARPGARVFIEKVKVFGSFAAGKETVSDIDLQIFSPMPDDCEPEDLEEQEAITGQIRISDYLSFHDEFDAVADAASGRTIYQRLQGSDTD